MSDPVTRAAMALMDKMSTDGHEVSINDCREYAALVIAAAGLLATPGHDAEVAARAWNEGFTAALLQVQYGMGRQRNPYEREGGAS